MGPFTGTSMLLVVLVLVVVPCCFGRDLQSEYMKGLQEHGRGDLVAAKKTFTMLVQEVGQYLPNVYVALCVVYEQMYDKEGAVNCYFEARERHPNDDTLNLSFCRYIASLFNIFQATFFPIGKALDACYKYQESQPNDPEIYYHFGNIYNGWRKYDQAHENYLHALSLTPPGPRKTEIFEDLIFSELRSGKLLNTNSHALELAEIDFKRAQRVVPHIFTISKPGDFRLKWLKNHVETYVSECGQTHHCNNPSQYEVIWRWSDIKNSQKLMKELPSIRKINLVNPETEGQLFGKPMPSKFYEVDDEVVFGRHKLLHISFDNAILYGREANVRFGCQFVLGNYAEWTPTTEMCENGHIKLKTLSSPLPILSTFPQYNPTNYFHWLIEGVVRLIVLLDSDEWAEGFSILVPQKKSYIVDSLALFGIEESQLIEFPHTQKQLVEVTSPYHMVDWEAPTIPAYDDDSWSQYYVSKDALMLARDTFNKILQMRGLITKGTKTKKNVLFVSRKSGDYSIRDIKNEPALKETLRKTASKYGASFSVHSGEESFLEQMQLFEKADIVIGAHGAGLANLLFSYPNTKVIMFPLEPNHDHTYEYIARALDFEIDVVNEITSYYYSSFGELSSKKLAFAAQALERALESFGKDEL